MSMATTAKAPKGYEAFSTLNPQQNQLFSILSQLLSGQGGQQGGPLGFLQNLLNPSTESAAAFEAPFKRQFQEEIIPGLAERFSGAGAGAQKSSAFQQALGQAGAGLSENLAGIRGGMQMQGLQGALQLLQSVLGQNTMGLVQKPMSFGKSLAIGGISGIGEGLGSLINPLSWRKS